MSRIIAMLTPLRTVTIGEAQRRRTGHAPSADRDDPCKKVSGRHDSAGGISKLLPKCLLARLHPFREEPNGVFASVTFSLASMEIITDPDEGICDILGGKVGIGDVLPLLGIIELAKRRR